MTGCAQKPGPRIGRISVPLPGAWHRAKNGRPPPDAWARTLKVRPAGPADPASAATGGAEVQLGDDDGRQHPDELLLPLGAVELAVRQALDLRQQGTQAGPQLVPGGAGLGVFRVHDFSPR